MAARLPPSSSGNIDDGEEQIQQFRYDISDNPEPPHFRNWEEAQRIDRIVRRKVDPWSTLTYPYSSLDESFGFNYDRQGVTLWIPNAENYMKEVDRLNSELLSIGMFSHDYTVGWNPMLTKIYFGIRFIGKICQVMRDHNIANGDTLRMLKALEEGRMFEAYRLPPKLKQMLGLIEIRYLATDTDNQILIPRIPGKPGIHITEACQFDTTLMKLLPNLPAMWSKMATLLELQPIDDSPFGTLAYYEDLKWNGEFTQELFSHPIEDT